MWRFCNPVEVSFGPGALESLPAKLGGRSYALVTYSDNGVFAELARRVGALAGKPVAVVSNIDPNPNFDGLAASCRVLGEAPTTPEVIVALGGGSVLDAAKVLAAAGGDFAAVERHLATGQGAERFRRLPIIAIPTTAGTGSEVTCWATVWDTAGKKKHSLTHPSLYAECALIDPTLTLEAPRGLTVSTGLDALSHALESIWNVNANPVSSALAEVAAREILECLDPLSRNLGDLALRTRLARASLLAGLAFSNTKTALAHSLSYHFTLHHGIAHGIACSFSLPMVMRSVIGHDPVCDASLRRVFGADLDAGARRLAAFLGALGVSTRAVDYGIAEGEWESLIDSALAGERGRNFIGKRSALR